MKTLTAILILLSLSLGAQTRERFLAYRVARIAPEEAPTIDGRLDEAVWQNRPAITALRQFLGPNKGDLPTQLSAFTILTDGSQIYIGAVFYEEAMDTLRADPARQPFWNDCIEVYFDPGNDGTRSIQLVVDCLGRRWWQKRFDEGYGWLEDSAWYMLADWEGRAVRHEDRWTVELRLNAASFGIDPSPGNTVGFNVCRFRLGGGEEYSAWAFGPTRNQKDMATWGNLIFQPAGQDAAAGDLTAADVATVYPRPWGDRIFELPVAAGMLLVSDAGERLVSYPELLGETAAETRRMLTAEAAIAAPLREQAQKLLATLDEPEWSLGRYERTHDALVVLNRQLHTAIWKERLATFVTEVHARQEE